MRVWLVYFALMLGWASTQASGNNYCNATGTFCGLCVIVGNNKSCSVCGKMGVSTPVKDVAGSNQCVEGIAKNCMQARDATTCSICNSGYALDTATNQCVQDKTIIPNCLGLTKTGTDINCQGCTNSKALSPDKKTCNTPVTDPNCLSAMVLVNPAQLCVACKQGFAKRGDMTANCDTPVQGVTQGCLVTDSNVQKCLFCNTQNGYWMTDVNVCTRKSDPSSEILQKFIRAYPEYNQQQKLNAELIYEEFVNIGLSLDSQVAYGLATAVVESNLIPQPEARAPPNTEKRREQDDYWYTGFYGRGYVQLTWNYNYQQFSALLKTDFYNNPDLALDPRQAARIMAYGMKNGSFTGKQLDLYVNQTRSDFMEARRVMDQNLKNASQYAQVAEKILAAQSDNISLVI